MHLAKNRAGVEGVNSIIHSVKSKVMRCTRNEDGARLNVMLNGEALEVDQFKYLGSVIAANGGVEADVRQSE